MPMYLLVDGGSAETSVDAVLAFTRKDHYKPLPGYLRDGGAQARRDFFVLPTDSAGNGAFVQPMKRSAGAGTVGAGQ
jgi:hypothetical protein